MQDTAAEMTDPEAEGLLAALADPRFQELIAYWAELPPFARRMVRIGVQYKLMNKNARGMLIALGLALVLGSAILSMYAPPPAVLVVGMLIGALVVIAAVYIK